MDRRRPHRPLAIADAPAPAGQTVAWVLCVAEGSSRRSTWARCARSAPPAPANLGVWARGGALGPSLRYRFGLLRRREAFEAPAVLFHAAEQFAAEQFAAVRELHAERPESRRRPPSIRN